MINSIGIIGSGLAGVTVARSLRALGYSGKILLFGEEEYHAYDRPSLSKAALLDNIPQPISLVPEGSFEKEAIEIHANRVASFDPDSMVLRSITGDVFSVDKVVFATGLRPIELDFIGSKLVGVMNLRTWSDQVLLRGFLKPEASIVIVGGGLIGCEVASTAKSLRANVTILEAGDEILSRVLGKAVGQRCRSNLEAIGIDVRLRTSLERVEGSDKVEAVIASDGSRIEADAVLIAIGGLPDTEVAKAAGINCDRGIVVDAYGQTSHKDVFAAGDVANWPLADGTRRSLETYLNTQDQANCVAESILGKGTARPQLAKGWTEIAGRKIQFVGDMTSPGQLLVRRYESGNSHIAFIIGEEGTLRSALAVDAPKEFALAMRLVEKNLKVPLEDLACPDVSLREIIKASQELEKMI